MTKQLLIVAGTALMAVALLAQPSPYQSPFQHPGWIAAPGSEPITVHMNRPEGQSGPVLAKPFSAAEVRHTVQTLADGTHVNHSDISAFYRDDRGRMRTESPTNVLIYDPVAGFIYHLDPGTKRYSKTPVPDKANSTSIVVIGDSTWVSNKSDRSTSPVETVRPIHGQLPFHAEPVAHSVTEALPTQVISGISVKGSRVTMTIPVGTFGNDREVKVINERWYSDDLQVLVKSSNSDPRFGVTTYELTNIVQAPPNPALFQVPADYTLRVEEQRPGGRP
ncbi:MAG: hypothetical protein DMG59_01795 [Acidobacteria bacterium]|jgi:hypothetical protein|nr:MAG: hypothetical protein DMG59_01795 [Acidobacteriota bacterium]